MLKNEYISPYNTNSIEKNTVYKVLSVPLNIDDSGMNINLGLEADCFNAAVLISVKLCVRLTNPSERPVVMIKQHGSSSRLSFCGTIEDNCFCLYAYLNNLSGMLFNLKVTHSNTMFYQTVFEKTAPPGGVVKYACTTVMYSLTFIDGITVLPLPDATISSTPLFMTPSDEGQCTTGVISVSSEIEADTVIATNGVANFDGFGALIETAGGIVTIYKKGMDVKTAQALPPGTYFLFLNEHASQRFEHTF